MPIKRTNKKKKVHNKVEDELNRKDSELKERIKELNCIYRISEIVEELGEDMDRTMDMAVNALPVAMRFSEIASARITIGEKEYKTSNYKETSWLQEIDIRDGNTSLGKIEVNYLEQVDADGSEPFLKEEIKLLRVISDILKKYILKYYSDGEVKNYLSQLKNLVSDKGSGFENMLDSSPRKGEEWKVIIDLLHKTDTETYLRMSRRMMYYLAHHREGSLDGLLQRMSPSGPEFNDPLESNMPNPRFDIEALIEIQKGVFDLASSYLTSNEIMDLLIKWLKENKSRPLLLVSEQSRIPLEDLHTSMDQYMKIPEQDRVLPPEEDRTIRTNLIRRLLNDRTDFINVATDYLKIEDFNDILQRFIGHYHGVGGLGGKASMVFLVEKILKKELSMDPDLESIGFAKSFYLGTDAMREFIHYNALDEVVQVKYMEPLEIKKEQPFLEQIFKNGTFVPEIVNYLKDILREFDKCPIIVRSSSQLEDSYGAAFSGKYKSLFITNQGTEEERLTSLMDAIAEVWSSTFGPNPIEYRRERGMLDLMENMGVLIQQVVGNYIGPYYTPAFAGVALSNNEFRWSPRINRRDGILRLVMGLGTRAVDRVANDYPLLVSPMKPGIRVNTSVEDIVRYSQRYMDVMNIKDHRLETLPVDMFIEDYSGEYVWLDRILSIYKDGTLVDPKAFMPGNDPGDIVVTFNGVIERTNFIGQIKKVMKLLKEKLGTPVDIEFAHDGNKLYILQCRPQIEGIVAGKITVPANILKKDTVFRANRYVTSGLVENIDYIVYVVPELYEKLESREDMMTTANLVSRLNLALPKRKFVLIGPGRWGSRGDIKLGVPVQYGDINNTSILIEVARSRGGYVPELSFGTHFFQDLVETNIHYLPLYPEEEGSFLNEELMTLSENRIGDLVPGIPAEMENVVKLIRTSDLSGGGSMNVVMDGEAGEALAYLTSPDHTSWRLKKIEEVLSDMDAKSLGVEEIYLIGSVKENRAGPASDIDLIVLFNGSRTQFERLEDFMQEWSEKLDEENFHRTNTRTGGLIDLHVVTHQDIADRTPWASHIRSIYDPARKLNLNR
ncbi:MAG: nucleotidyltransferase domain-containing protein [Candidatus Thermoplasmatota archaeon]|nr:nucleotidyltransferase domain-containing protein [Candidatus Thermoplasmatota archaeon]